MLLAPDCLFFDGSSVNFKVMIDLALPFTTEVFVNYVDMFPFLHFDVQGLGSMKSKK